MVGAPLQKGTKGSRTKTDFTKSLTVPLDEDPESLPELFELFERLGLPAFFSLWVGGNKGSFFSSAAYVVNKR